MEELLAQIVLALVETFFDAILELAGEALMDLLSRAASEVFKSDEPPHPIRSLLALGFLGALVGGASLCDLPPSAVSSLQISRHQLNNQPYRHGRGDVSVRGCTAQSR